MSSPKKKLTKKELKAQNHAKLMGTKTQQVVSQVENTNVIQLNAFKKDKKAA